MAGFGRVRQSEPRPEGFYSGWLRWCRNDCDSTRQTSRCDGRDHNERKEYRTGQESRSRYCHRLQRTGFETVLSGYDLVLNSQDPKTLEKSLRVLKPGGQLISISGPPDPAFARDIGLNLFLKVVTYLLSRGVRKTAKSLGVRYSFLFMRAHGQQ